MHSLLAGEFVAGAERRPEPGEISIGDTPHPHRSRREGAHLDTVPLAREHVPAALGSVDQIHGAFIFLASVATTLTWFPSWQPFPPVPMMTPSGSGPERSGSVSLTLLLAGIQLLAFCERFLLTVVAHPLKLDLGLTDAQLGILQGSAFVLLHALSLPVWGRAADRGRQPAMLATGIVVWSAAAIICGLGESFLVLVLARMLLGLGQAAVAPAALSLLAYRLPPGRLGRGVSWLTASASLGRSLALLAGGGVLALLTAAGGLYLPGLGHLPPWRALLVLACLPNILAVAAALRIAAPPARGSAARSRSGRAWAWIRRRRRPYLVLFGAAACAVLVTQTLAAWAPIFYVRAHGLTPAESGVHLGLLVLFVAPLGHLAGGRLIDRGRAAGRRAGAGRTLAAGLLLVPPCTAVMTLSDDLRLSLAGFAALAAALGLTSPAALAGLQFLTPASMRGFVSAMFIAGVTLVALGLGPVLVGLLNDHVFGQEAVGSALLAVFVAVALIGVVLASTLDGVVRAGRARP